MRSASASSPRPPEALGLAGAVLGLGATLDFAPGTLGRAAPVLGFVPGMLGRDALPSDFAGGMLGLLAGTLVFASAAGFAEGCTGDWTDRVGACESRGALERCAGVAGIGGGAAGGNGNETRRGMPG